MTPEAQAREFRRALGSFVSGVTVVTCLIGDVDHAMTASAVTSVSLVPQLILVSVSRTSRFWEAIKSQRHWGVSILAESARDHAAWLATKGRPLPGQLDRVPYHRGKHGVALLDQSLAWLECRTYQTVSAGDHDIVIGEVEHAQMGTENDPLVYWRSQYGRLAKP